MDIDSFVGSVLQASMSLEHARAVATANDLPLNRLLDLASLSVARKYQAGVLAYADADDIMNRIWALVYLQPPDDVVVPEITRAVFEAFDAGEYRHRDDSPDVDPEIKYTKPLVADVLARHGA